MSGIVTSMSEVFECTRSVKPLSRMWHSCTNEFHVWFIAIYFSFGQKYFQSVQIFVTDCYPSEKSIDVIKELFLGTSKRH